MGYHDRIPNKSIIYGARDAVATIGYAGSAYLDNVPTDEWIAERLWGGTLPEGRNGGHPIVLGIGPQFYDIGLATRIIKKALDGVKSLDVDVSIVLAGFQRKKKNIPVQFVIDIERRTRTAITSLKLHRAPINRHRRSWALVHELGGYLSVELGDIGVSVNQALQSLRAKHTEEEDTNIEGAISAVEEILVSRIKNASKKHGGVGPHIMTNSIFLNPSPNIVSKFHPNEAHIGEMTSSTDSSFRLNFPVHFCPWVIGRSTLVGPASTVGSLNTNIGNKYIGSVDVHLEGAPRHGRLLGAWSSQVRPSAPR